MEGGLSAKDSVILCPGPFNPYHRTQRCTTSPGWADLIHPSPQSLSEHVKHISTPGLVTLQRPPSLQHQHIYPVFCPKEDLGLASFWELIYPQL